MNVYRVEVGGVPYRVEAGNQSVAISRAVKRAKQGAVMVVRSSLIARGMGVAEYEQRESGDPLIILQYPRNSIAYYSAAEMARQLQATISRLYEGTPTNVMVIVGKPHKGNLPVFETVARMHVPDTVHNNITKFIGDNWKEYHYSWWKGG